MLFKSIATIPTFPLSAFSVLAVDEILQGRLALDCLFFKQELDRLFPCLGRGIDQNVLF